MKNISTNRLLKLSFPIIILFLYSFSSIPYETEKEDLKNLNDFREKVYLHTDKSYYNSGDDLWFKVYLVDAYSNRPEALSNIVHVNLINVSGALVLSRMVRINEGCGIGDFKLPDNLIIGEYTIRAYTNFMRNFNDSCFFRKKIFVNSSWTNKIANQKVIEDVSPKSTIEPKPDVQFFPEGGYMVDGFLNRIGFKAVGFNGKGIEISGSIIDNSEEKIVDFKTTNLGLGMIKFAPMKDKTYRARIVYNNMEYIYNLPMALTSGALMQVTEEPDAYSILIHSTLVNGVKNFKFVGKQKNRVVNGSELTSELEGAKFKISKSLLEQGIAQFTLYDNNNVPLCERLVFVEKEDSINKVRLYTPRTNYGKRELIELEISPEQVKNQSLNANMSLAVTDISGTETDQFGFDIKSYLLLNSDLRGEIEQPGYYFYSDDPQRKQVLDLLMMTQGWRQFILNDTLNTNTSPKFPHETAISLEGDVKRFSSKGKPAKAQVSLIYPNQGEVVTGNVVTDDRGHFAFENLDFADGTSIMLQAKTYKERKEKSIDHPNTNYYIVMDSLVVPKEPIRGTISPASDKSQEQNSPSSQTTAEEPEIAFQTQKGDILIEEVKVAAKKIDRFAEKRILYTIPSINLDFKEIRKKGDYGNVFQALRGRLAGVRILGDMNNPMIIMRGNGTLGFQNGAVVTNNSVINASPNTDPLFLLDGFPTQKEVILNIPLSQIDFVDVLKGGQAAIYGSQGINGILAVYTLRPNDVLDKTKVGSSDKCILKFNSPGYSIARKFYEPVYESTNSVQDKPDNRSTIYWNPMIELKNQDKIDVAFYSADLPTTYKITLEGITSEGGIIKSEKFIHVK
jgi:hypothetical protein